MNGVKARVKSVRRDLEASSSSFIKFFSEGQGIPTCSPSEMPGQDEFRLSFNPHEAISIATAGIARCIPFFFASDEAPQLIALDIRHRHAFDSAFKKPLALVPNEVKQGKNRGVMEACYSLCRTDRASLSKKLYCLARLVQRRVHRAKRCRVILGEGRWH